MKRHLRSSKTCRARRNLLVYCQRCCCMIRVAQIRNHHNECDPGGAEARDKRVVTMDVKAAHTITELREELRGREEEVMQLTIDAERADVELRWERIQKELFKQLLRTHTDIPVDTLIEQKEDGLHIYAEDGKPQQVFVHEAMRGKRGRTRKYDLEEHTSRTIYRTVKNQIELVEEKPEERKELVERVEEVLEAEREQNCSVEDIERKMGELFENVEKGRVYSAPLKEMRPLRHQLLHQMSVSDYTELLQEHVAKLNEIFKGKDMKGKRLRTMVRKALSPLDMRLCLYHDFYNVSIELDEMTALEAALTRNMEHAKTYTPFDRTAVFSRLHNYSVALFPLRKLAEKALINRYGCHSLIYLEMPRSTDVDPYSYYTLASINKKGIRQWKMECRLEDLSSDFGDRIRSYAIELFRRVYFKSFNDNEYREDYATHFKIMQEDMEQLMQNIWLLSMPTELRNALREIVKRGATVHPTDYDKCHLTRDDALQQRRLKDAVDDDEQLILTATQLFDDLTPATAMRVWSDRHK